MVLCCQYNSQNITLIIQYCISVSSLMGYSQTSNFKRDTLQTKPFPKHYLVSQLNCSCLALFMSTAFILTEKALQRHLHRLPEPPMIRENLKKEIQMFVEMLQQKAKEEGRYSVNCKVSFINDMLVITRTKMCMDCSMYFLKLCKLSCIINGFEDLCGLKFVISQLSTPSSLKIF